MQRCMQCEATMTPKELNCPNCGSSALPKSARGGIKHHFRTIIKVLFLVSAVMSVLALFTSWGPPFMTCVAVTLVLLLVKNSADEMLFDSDRS